MQQDAEKLIKFCKDNKVQCFAVKQLRLNKNLQRLKNAVRENKFGKIINFSSKLL